jgi:hypothetical protein
LWSTAPIRVASDSYRTASTSAARNVTRRAPPSSDSKINTRSRESRPLRGFEHRNDEAAN